MSTKRCAVSHYSLAFILLLPGSFATSHVKAAGFAIWESSARQLGSAFAGGSSSGSDASTVWFNPAGITRLNESLQFSGHFIDPEFKFRDQNSLQLNPVINLPLLADSESSSDGGKSAAVPSFYYSVPISDVWHFGIGLNAPFGLVTEYPGDWKGRYQTLKSDIKTVNVVPALAAKLNDQISVGASLSINFIEATLTNAVDFSAVCAQLAASVCPNGSLPGQGQFDGFARNKAEDVSVGWNFGLLWQATNSTQIGIVYRSEIAHSLEGQAEFSQPQTLGGFAALGELGEILSVAFSNTANRASVRLPDSLSLGLTQQLSATVSLMADLSWTDWSDIPELRIQFDNPLTPTAVENLDWRESWRYALGLEVALTNRWTVRTGIAVDKAPVDNAQARTPRLPDNDRRWLSVGLGYQASETITVNMGYSHLFINDAPINRIGSTETLLRGSYSAKADIYGIQLDYNF